MNCPKCGKEMGAVTSRTSEKAWKCMECGVPSKWPKQYAHKETKKRVRVMPWLECAEPVLTDEDIGDLAEGRKILFGMLVQVGWLLENEHGVWFGVGPKALEHFEEINPKEPRADNG